MDSGEIKKVPEDAHNDGTTSDWNRFVKNRLSGSVTVTVLPYRIVEQNRFTVSDRNGGEIASLDFPYCLDWQEYIWLCKQHQHLQREYFDRLRESSPRKGPVFLHKEELDL